MRDRFMRVEQLTENDEDKWNDLLSISINGSYRQSMAIEYAHILEGRKIHSYLFYKDKKVVAGVHYSLKYFPMKLGLVADVLSGWVFSEEPNYELLSYLIKHFIKWAKQHSAAIIRFNFWLPENISGQKTSYASLVEELTEDNKCKFLTPGRSTYWIDLTQDEDSLMAKMKAQTRYNIRKAYRMGMQIEVHENPNNKVFETFWQLYNKRASQKNLDDQLSYKRVKAEVMPMMKSGLGLMFFAKYEDKVRNVTFASNFGQAASLHSGMDPDVSKDKTCPSPGHILRWEIIKTLKARKLKIHDMGFCPGPVPVKGDSHYGIWKFKHGFGGDYIKFTPVYVKVLKPIIGNLAEHILHIR